VYFLDAHSQGSPLHAERGESWYGKFDPRH
jgi:hypothetical protein